MTTVPPPPRPSSSSSSSSFLRAFRVIDEKVPVFWADWSKAVQENFEKNFWVPVDPKDDYKYKINAALVNRRSLSSY